MKVGYMRVSTVKQSEASQLDALHAAGVEDKNIFTDKISGSVFTRDGLDKALAFVREGDEFVVWKLDRLGRKLKDLIAISDALEKKKVEFVSITDKLDTKSLGGRLIFQIMGALAEWERGVIIERTTAGLAAARARGRNGGRPRKMTPSKIARARELYSNKDLSVDAICGMLHIARPTLYEYLDLKHKQR
jgi:DNA invertase Pin-like site-specific DNA recombinase